MLLHFAVIILVTVTYSTSPEPIKPSVCFYVCFYYNRAGLAFRYNEINKQDRGNRNKTPDSDFLKWVGKTRANREPVERVARARQVLNAGTSKKKKFTECEGRDSRARSARPPSAKRESVKREVQRF